MSRLFAWGRERRASILIAIGLLVAVASVLSTQDGATNNERLDPQNPGVNGAQALAQVLGSEGVEVEIVRSASALTAADAGPGATVVVTSPGNLGVSTAGSLFSAAAGADVFVVDAGPGVVEIFDSVPSPSTEELGGGLSGPCALPRLANLTLEVDSALAYPGPGGCFTTGERSVLLPTSSAMFFGGGEALTNDQILRGDNAAIALRAFGQHQRLVWYIPDLADTSPSESASLSRLIPRWIAPGLWIAALSVIALVFWRGRRLGPLSTEPLPVTVKAIETTASRGRLYRRAGDRGHAASVLRASARSMAARHLRLGKAVEEDVLIRELASRSGRSVSDVAALIGSAGATPNTDRDLITLANDLAAIDREVHTP